MMILPPPRGSSASIRPPVACVSFHIRTFCVIICVCSCVRAHAHALGRVASHGGTCRPSAREMRPYRQPAGAPCSRLLLPPSSSAPNAYSPIHLPRPTLVQTCERESSTRHFLQKAFPGPREPLRSRWQRRARALGELEPGPVARALV